MQEAMVAVVVCALGFMGFSSFQALPCLLLAAVCLKIAVCAVLLLTHRMRGSTIPRLGWTLACNGIPAAWLVLASRSYVIPWWLPLISALGGANMVLLLGLDENPFSVAVARAWQSALVVAATCLVIYCLRLLQ